MSKLVLIPQEHTEKVWPLCRDYLKKAVDRGDGLVSLDDHYLSVIEGNRQLWVIWNEGECLAALVTEIMNDRCLIWLCGGKEMRGWLHLHHVLEQYARECGCVGLTLYGRSGWERALETFGYKRRMVIMNKEIEP